MNLKPFLHIICVVFIFTALSCTIPNQRDPVVKPSPPKPEVETEKQKPIMPQDTRKIMEQMPVTKTIEVRSENTEINVEGAVNPITYQSNFAVILNDGKKNNFTKEDYSRIDRWNELIKKKETKKSAFEIDQNLKVVKVIVLEGVNRESKKILEEYKSEIEILDDNEVVFFLTFEESQKNILDPARSFMGVKIEILDKISSGKFKLFPGVFAYDEGNCVIRAAATQSKNYRKGRVTE